MIYRGQIRVYPPLEEAQVAYLARFAETQRVARVPYSVDGLPDVVRFEAGLLTAGMYGDFYVGESDLGMIGRQVPPGHRMVQPWRGVETEPGSKVYVECEGDQLTPMGLLSHAGHGCVPLEDTLFLGYPDDDPARQPSQRCPWTPTADGKALEGVENGYKVAEWLIWIHHNLLRRWGYRRIDGVVHGWDPEGCGGEHTLILADKEGVARVDVDWEKLGRWMRKYKDRWSEIFAGFEP